MEKKRSVGVTVIGVIMLLYGIIGLVLYGESLSGLYAFFSPLVLLISFATGNHLLDSVMFTIISGFVLIRRNWARKFTVVASIILSFCHLPNAILVLINPNRISTNDTKYWYGLPSVTAVLWMTYIPIILYGLFIYFFTRPKIKEQFK